MYVIVFAGGTLQSGSAVAQALAESEMVVAADGGALAALERGCVPAFVVGDGDSLPPATLTDLRQRGSRIVLAPVEKDETDTELAIELALQQGATRITILGALGGERFDHTIANLLLLTSYPGMRIEIADGNARSWLLCGPGTALIEGKQGDLLSLFPLMASARGVRTEHLFYPLHGETLHFGRPRGISNVLLGKQASVALDEGLLLIVHLSIA
jgi:thiamine pyrophosphokinase